MKNVAETFQKRFVLNVMWYFSLTFYNIMLTQHLNVVKHFHLTFLKHVKKCCVFAELAHVVIWRSFLGMLWESYNNLTCYWSVPLPFVWQDLRTDVSNLTQVTNMIEDELHACDMCFWKFMLLSNTKPTPWFLADADGCVSWFWICVPRIKHGKLCKIVFSLRFGPKWAIICC